MSKSASLETMLHTIREPLEDFLRCVDENEAEVARISAFRRTLSVLLAEQQRALARIVQKLEGR